MTTPIKLSQLMEQGAEVLEPYEADYFSPDGKAACALGCAIWAVNKGKLDNWGIEQVYSVTTDAIEVMIVAEDLPKDIYAATRYMLFADKDDETLTLHDVITGTNDNISRARAIEITKALGY